MEREGRTYCFLSQNSYPRTLRGCNEDLYKPLRTQSASHPNHTNHKRDESNSKETWSLNWHTNNNRPILPRPPLLLHLLERYWSFITLTLRPFSITMNYYYTLNTSYTPNPLTEMSKVFDRNLRDLAKPPKYLPPTAK